MTYQPFEIELTVSPLYFFCLVTIFYNTGRTFAEAPVEPIILTIDLLVAVKLPPRGILRLETCCG